MSHSTTACVFFGVAFTRINPPRTGDGEILTSEDLETLADLKADQMGDLTSRDNFYDALFIPESFRSVNSERGKFGIPPTYPLQEQPGWRARIEEGLASLRIINAPPIGWHFAWITG